MANEADGLHYLEINQVSRLLAARKVSALELIPPAADPAGLAELELELEQALQR